MVVRIEEVRTASGGENRRCGSENSECIRIEGGIENRTQRGVVRIEGVVVRIKCVVVRTVSGGENRRTGVVVITASVVRIEGVVVRIKGNER